MLRERTAWDELDVRTYHAAREGVAVMDRSAWGRVQMMGEDRIDFLHRMSTNEVRDLEPGVGRRTVLTSDIGRIVAVVTAYTFPDHLLLLTHPDGASQVIDHLRRYVFFRDQVRFKDVTGETGMLSLWGPRALACLNDLAQPAIPSLAVEAFVETQLDGIAAVVAHIDELGLHGFNLIVSRKETKPLLDRLVEAGAQPMDMAVYETLRVEAGQPLYGRELGEAFNPLEAGLKPIISFEKGCYIGQEVIARLDTYQKVKQHLVRVQLERLPSAEGRPALVSDGEEIGFLTSWVRSPTYGPIALGYIRTKRLTSDLTFEVADETGPISGQVVGLNKEH